MSFQPKKECVCLCVFQCVSVCSCTEIVNKREHMYNEEMENGEAVTYKVC